MSGLAGAQFALPEAVEMLRESQRQLPHDYNPPNRLARAYAALERWEEAMAESARAAALAPGRAKLRVLATRAELLEKKGDLAAARDNYEKAYRIDSTHGPTLAARRPRPA